jgi:DNA-directed RNA polymerase subunit RPC12/RpoP
MMKEEVASADKLIKYECSTCEEEITLHLKAVIYTKVVNCPFCNPSSFDAVG